VIKTSIVGHISLIYMWSYILFPGHQILFDFHWGKHKVMKSDWFHIEAGLQVFSLICSGIFKLALLTCVTSASGGWAVWNVENYPVLNNFQHTVQLTPESQSCTSNSSHKYLRIRITQICWKYVLCKVLPFAAASYVNWTLIAQPRCD
jgi:hypothetical protein